MLGNDCKRNCWLAGAIGGFLVWLFTAGFGPVGFFAGLFLGLMTAWLLGGLLVWGICSGRGGRDEDAELLGDDFARTAVAEETGVLARAEAAVAGAGAAIASGAALAMERGRDAVRELREEAHEAKDELREEYHEARDKLRGDDHDDDDDGVRRSRARQYAPPTDGRYLDPAAGDDDGLIGDDEEVTGRDTIPSSPAAAQPAAFYDAASASAPAPADARDERRDPSQARAVEMDRISAPGGATVPRTEASVPGDSVVGWPVTPDLEPVVQKPRKAAKAKDKKPSRSAALDVPAASDRSMTTAVPAKAEKAEKPQKADKPSKADKASKVDKPAKADKPAKIKAEKPAKADKADKTAKADKVKAKDEKGGKRNRARMTDAPAAIKLMKKAAKAARADELLEINGVGPVMKRALIAMGITRFAQIASWTPDEAARIGDQIGIGDRVLSEDWIGQAKTLASGGSTEHSRKVARGEA